MVSKEDTLDNCFLQTAFASKPARSFLSACIGRASAEDFGLTASDPVKLWLDEERVLVSRAHGQSPQERDALGFELQLVDLLGVVVLENGTTILQLVHCPRSNDGQGERHRADVLVSINDVRTSQQDATAWAARVTQRCCTAPETRSFLVLVNPFSGTGNATSCWDTTRDLWDSLPWLQYREVTTTAAGEAVQLAKEADPANTDGIVVVSGDGMVHEVFNGLSCPADKGKAFQIPVGHIPGGTGNGLAKSILEAAGESYGVLDMAFLIAKGNCGKIHLQTVSAQGEEARTSFLSLTSGVLADIDIGSELFRSLGSIRNLLYAPVSLSMLRTLDADLVYWPAGDTSSFRPTGLPPPLDQPLQDGPWKTISDQFAVFLAVNTAWISFDALAHPDVSLHEDSWAIVMLRNAGRFAVTRFLLGLETGSQVQQEGVEVVWCHAFRLTPRNSEALLVVDGEPIPTVPVQCWPAAAPGLVLGALSQASKTAT